ncbi:MAG: butyrate kinase, partial [Bacilli bacterium]|nr:butyrate kinase [Bacilli bacterium]
AEIQSFKTVASQFEFRKQMILDFLNENKFDMKLLDAICGRGGINRPLASGTYLVNDLMIHELKEAIRGEHASNLGSILASEIANPLGIPAYTVDPVVVDEMEDIARISGMPLIQRQSIFHALNHKAIARRVSRDVGKRYEDLNLLLVHMGGGISIGVHRKGRVIDVNDALDGDGPMSPERSGTVPLGPLYKMCFSGKYSLQEITRMNYGKGGLVAYLGSSDAREVVKRIEAGDKYAKLVYDAMIYQIAKEIGAASTVLCGEVDYIILTGGLAYEPYLTTELPKRIKFIAPILIYPGENEMLSLAQGAMRVLNGQEIPKNYE